MFPAGFTCDLNDLTVPLNFQAPFNLSIDQSVVRLSPAVEARCPLQVPNQIVKWSIPGSGMIGFSGGALHSCRSAPPGVCNGQKLVV